MTVTIGIETREAWEEKRYKDLRAEFGSCPDMLWETFLDQRYKEYENDLIKQATDNYSGRTQRRSLDGKETQ